MLQITADNCNKTTESESFNIQISNKKFLEKKGANFKFFEDGPLFTQS